MTTSDRTIKRAISDLRFAIEDLKTADKADAVKRGPLINEALERIKRVAASIEGGAS